MDFKKTLYALVFALIVPLASADVVKLADGHPTEYVVVKGDTLWDISGRFLEKPWLWPEIWDRNPQIENPHLIYPGDVVSLVYRNGKPVLQVNRGGAMQHKGPRPVVKLSPQIRAEQREKAIPVIPIDAVGQFLNESLVISEAELEKAPYIVSPGRERLASDQNTIVYVRGLADDSPRRLGIYRKGQPYVDPDSGELLGNEAVFVGDAVVEDFGDPARVLITRSLREILVGDRLIPVAKDHAFESFLPNEPEQPVAGSIISVVDGVSQIGQHDVVVLNLGGSSVAVGDVLAVFQRGQEITDKFVKPEPFRYEGGPKGPPEDASFDKDIDLFVDGIKRAFTHQKGEPVTLPDERAGVLMVFRTFDKVSYGLVMESTRAIHINDRVGNP